MTSCHVTKKAANHIDFTDDDSRMSDAEESRYRAVERVLTGAVSKVLSQFKDKPSASGRKRRSDAVQPLPQSEASSDDDRVQHAASVPKQPKISK